VRTTIVYRDRNGQVEKEVSVRNVTRGDGVAPNFHENIIKTYHQLEERGELKMGAREKTAVRDCHTYAQDKRYWYSNMYGHQGHGE
jgi:hypothetical protein